MRNPDKSYTYDYGSQRDSKLETLRYHGLTRSVVRFLHLNNMA